MATQPYYDGPALIRTGTGSAGALEDLGYTQDGAEPEFQAFWLDVHGDQNGGTDGPPIDIQYLGEIAIIRLLFTKWDAAVADKVAARLLSGTTGTPGTPGTLTFTESKTIRLLISPTSRPLNFPRTICRGNISINKGVKHSKLALEFEAHKDASGVLYNTSTS